MNSLALTMAIASLSFLAVPPVKAAAPAASDALKAAVSDSSRPPADVAQDVNRKPLEVFPFTGVKPGDKVVERFPGHGYYTRILAKLVGPKGKVYVVLMKNADGSILDIDKAQPVADAYPNVVLVPRTSSMPLAAEKIDVVLSTQNYHDLHNGEEAATGAATLNKTVFQTLKPGGLYVVIDHAAPSGAGISLTPKLHRIEMETCKAEVLAAGFKFVDSAETLRNPADPRTIEVWNPAVQGKTDQFMLKFRKP